MSTPSPVSRLSASSRALGSSWDGSSFAPTDRVSNWSGRLPSTWVTAAARLLASVPWQTIRMPIMGSSPPSRAILAERPGNAFALSTSLDQRFGKAARDVEPRLLGDLDESCGAGDVDLGEIVADHVKSDYEHPFGPQLGADT